MNWRHSILFVRWNMHYSFSGFPSSSFGRLSAFCISSWIATSALVGWLPSTSTLFPHSVSINNWPSSTFLFVKMHLSDNSCWHLLGPCSTQEFKAPKEKKELADMLRWLIQFLWLVSLVSQFEGEALTCYSCGPHSDQVMPLTFQRVASILGEI